MYNRVVISRSGGQALRNGSDYSQPIHHHHGKGEGVTITIMIILDTQDHDDYHHHDHHCGSRLERVIGLQTDGLGAGRQPSITLPPAYTRS